MKNLKGFLYCIACVATMVVASCSSDRTADVRDLLKTVPSDASAVAVIDLKSVLEKAGCDVDGTDIKPGKEIVKALEASGNSKAKDFAARMQEGGADPSAIIFFIEGYNSYISGFVADTDKFKTFVEKEYGASFQNDGEVSTCGNIAIAGDRFWVCISSNNTVNSNDIKHFNSLSEKQSILSNEIAAGLEELKHDISGWGDIKGCLNTAGLDFSSKASATMAIEAMFVDAVEFMWNLDFKKGKLEADATVLNSKGGIAKFNFPAAKIDAAVINDLGGTADGFVALAVNPDMVKKLKEETGGKGFSVIGMLSGMISCVDGTCAAAFSGSGNVRGVLSTTGHGTADLSSMLGEMGLDVSKEAKALRFSKGEVSGQVSAASAADELKGALAGVVYADGSKRLPSEAISSVTVTFSPEKGGIEAGIKVTGKDSKKNILLSIIEASGK